MVLISMSFSLEYQFRIYLLFIMHGTKDGIVAVSNLSHTRNTMDWINKRMNVIYRIEYCVILDKIVWFSIIFFSIFSCKHTISHMNIYWRTIRIGIVTTLESLQWLYYMIDRPTKRPTDHFYNINRTMHHSFN